MAGDLVISKSLRREYKNKTGVIQAVVNDQIKEFTPGREFSPGDRVPFFIVNGRVDIRKNMEPAIRSKSNSLAERAVFTDFFNKFEIFQNNIDWVYYIERIRPAIIQILSLVIPGLLKNP